MPAKIPKPTSLKELLEAQMGTFVGKNDTQKVNQSVASAVGQHDDARQLQEKTQIDSVLQITGSDKIQEHLKNYLLAVKKTGCSSSTIRNYRSDINQFFDFADIHEIHELGNKPKLLAFAHYQREKGLKEASIKRKLVSVTQFKVWLKEQGLLVSEIPLRTASAQLQRDRESQQIIDQTQKQEAEKTRIPDQKNQTKSRKPRNRLFIVLNILALLFFLGGLAYFAYQQFGQAIISMAYPSTPTPPNRILSYQGRLTDTAQNPITTPTDMVYRLYDADTGGTLLWSSNTCSIDPDQDGIFNANLGAGAGTGSDGENCGGTIAESVFTENANIWLEVEVLSEILTPRQPIRTVAYALNTATLQGLPPAEIATNSTILMMNASGEVVLGTDNPVIKAATTSSGLTIEANQIQIQTYAGSNGNIVLNPDGTGIVDIQSDADVDGDATFNGNVYISSPNSLIFGGTTALGEISGANDSGAYLVGAYDEFDNSNSTNVQGVLNDLDDSIAGLINGTSGVWTDSGTLTYMTSTTDDFAVGGSSLASPFSVDVSDNTVRIGSGATTNATLNLYASDGDTGSLSYTTSDALVLSGGDLGLAAGSYLNWGATTGTSGYGFRDNAGTIQFKNSSGTWTDIGTGSGGDSFWLEGSGALYAANPTLDLLIGGSATNSAKFAFTNIAGGTPTFSMANQASAIDLADSTINALNIESGLLSFDTSNSRIGIGTTTPGALLSLAAATTSNAQLNLASSSGVDPSSLVSGDLWWDGTSLNFYDGSSTNDLLAGGSSLWVDAGTYIYPAGGLPIGNPTSGGANKVSGLYMADSGPLYFGTDNDVNFSFSGSTLSTTLGSNDWNIGSDLLFLDGSSNKVGIGTNTPLATLDVRAADPDVAVASFSGSTNLAALIVNQTGSGDIFTASASGVTQFVVTNSGNVGIGVAAPTSRLQIAGASSTISNDSGDITIDAASNNISLAGDNLINVGNGLFGGSVGIGTVTPDRKLEIVDAADPQLRLTHTEGSIYADFHMNSNGDLVMNVDSITNQLVLDNGGNVGIGVTNPDEKLTVSGSVNAEKYYDYTNKNYFLDPAAVSTALKIAGDARVGGDVYVEGGEIFFTPLSFSTSTTEGTLYYDNDVDHLYLYDGNSTWHRVALDMTKYSTDGTVANQDYLQIAHNQNSNDLTFTVWVRDKITNLWRKIDPSTATIDHDLQNEFNPDFTQKEKVSEIKLQYKENNLGTGADGAIVISSSVNLNTAAPSGRSCADAILYSVSSLTSTTAVLTSSPPTPSCLAPDDEVLLINLMGDNTSVTNVGNYETLRVSSVVGSTVTFKSAKTKWYGRGASDDTGIGTTEGTQRVMLQRVPNYTNVTVNNGGTIYPSAWNGAVGGVVFFRATGTVSVAGGGQLTAGGNGYRGGGYYSTWYGGMGGESMWADNAYGGDGVEGGGMGGYGPTPGGGYTPYGGGGGGGGARGHDTPGTGAGSAGTASRGGAGGGGGGAYSSNASYNSRGGGGGGGGYGTVGQGGYGWGYAGANGGTDSSGAGGNGYAPDHAGGGGGGGGGLITTPNNLTQLRFGSGGGAGGAGEVSQVQYQGGNGGNGGGIVYIAANSISNSGNLHSNGATGSTPTCYSTSWCGGPGGSGAGGSVKLVANTLTIGSNIVTASGGGNAGGTVYGAYGGAGGSGKIAIFSAGAVSGTTSPTYTALDLEYSNYAIFTSDEISTADATAFNTISWSEDLDTNGEIQLQTRSGATADSTDGSWEGWKPVVNGTNELVLDNANTHSGWTTSTATTYDGDILRYVKTFEDENETNSGNITKVAFAGSGNAYIESTFAAQDLTNYDYITLWIRGSAMGETVKIGMGEAAATEQEETIFIDKVNVWQKVYWDITDVAAASKNAVTKFRVTGTTANTTVYVDNVKAARYLTTNAGSTVSSTANDYFQYRVILSTTNSLNTPRISKIKLNMTNADKGTFDLDVDEVNPSNYQDNTDSSVRNKEAITLDRRNYDLGTGADGAIVISSTVNLNTAAPSGRSCADAIQYSVSSLTSTTAVLTSSPPTPSCLAPDDEVLLINLMGDNTSVTNVGNYETLRVSSVVGSTVTFKSAKTKWYGRGASDDTGIGTTEGTQRVMLQRVPNYTNVTVNNGGYLVPSAWNGAVGGVMFFRATGTVSVAGGGYIHANDRGYRGGGYYNTWYGGMGGESMWADNAYGGDGVEGGGMGGYYNSGAGYTPYGGGGGGGGARGHDTPGTGAGSAGTASRGGAGGGGGGAYSSNASYNSRGGGGGGGGYGTVGQGGLGWGYAGANGGTDSSGAGGNGYAPDHAGGGGGGGGGLITTPNNLTQLRFGSGGGAGGAGEVSQVQYQGGNGGNGGGIVYIAANSISNSGYIISNGTIGANPTCYSTSWCGGPGGSGAGGSVKLVANTLTIGASLVQAVGGGNAGGTVYGAYGGAGGSGKIAIYADTSISGTTSPTYTSDTTTAYYNSYKIFTSNEISTADATAFNTISWSEDLDTNGEIQLQTRSGATADSTDGSWEGWKPVVNGTNELVLDSMDAYASWTGSNATVGYGDTARNVAYYEDEDEPTAANTVKATATAANGTVSKAITSTNISAYRYISFWVRSSVAGESFKMRFTNNVTNNEKDFYITTANQWQKVYWDVSALTRNDVNNLRFTIVPNGAVVHVDNIRASNYLSTNTGSTITSTVNDYIQYRAILTTTSQLNSPTLGPVTINITTPSGSVNILDNVSNQNTVDIYEQNSRVNLTTAELDDIKSSQIIKKFDSVTQAAGIDTGTGADGAITISGTTNFNTQESISGRDCLEGGDAPMYSVSALTSTTVTLTRSPSTPSCIAPDDEILLINLMGDNSSVVNVGNYETLRVEEVNGSVITFKSAKTKWYGRGAEDDTGIGTTEGTQRVMLQRVPNYTSVTVTNGGTFSPSAWNGAVGGVMFFRATGTVSVAGGGYISTYADGYRGGGYFSGWYGGVGGESMWADNTYDGVNFTGGGMGGYGPTPGGGYTAIGGGGGGGGARAHNSPSGAAGSAGTTTRGGGGGGGGGSYGDNASYHGHGGGGGGGGYGSAGTGGNAWGNAGGSGGTDVSGAGGTGYAPDNAGGGGGGGGGSINTPSDLSKLRFGSGGGGGGAGEVSQVEYAGGAGGNGGGILFIAADNISSGGYISSTAGSGSGGTQYSSSWAGGGGGGGAGGSIKLIARTLTLGNGYTQAYGGSGGAGDSSGNSGGAGGMGKIAIHYAESVSGVTGPTYYAAEVPTYHYSMLISDEIPTPNAVSYDKIRWNADLDNFGLVSIQTRSGATDNSTDNSWEAWKPLTLDTNYVNLDDANTHGNWTSTAATLTISDGDITRDIDFFEDEDESTVGNTTKLVMSASNTGVAERNIGAVDLTNYDYITLWVYSSRSGNTVTVGMGEDQADEHEQMFSINAVNTWQKIYWDISKIPGHEKDAVKYLRVTPTFSTSGYNLYIDNLRGEKLLTNAGGSTISSKPNQYLQYRVILSSTREGSHPTLYNVGFDWNNGYKVEQTNSNNVRLYNYTGEEQEMRLDVIVFGADLAEWYTVEDDSIMPADLVSLTGEMDEYGVPILRKSTKANDPMLAGVISTQAGTTLGIEAPNRRLLALDGRVPVKIDPDSPAIEKGDHLTSSNKVGMARKARPGELSIARSFEDWSPETGKDRIMALVNDAMSTPSFSQQLIDGVVEIADLLNIKIQDNWEVINHGTGESIKSAVALAQAVIGKLKVGQLEVQEITAPADGELSLEGSNIAIQLNDQEASGSTSLGRLVIQNQAGETVASFDSEGNAYLSGNLDVEGISQLGQLLAEEASVSSLLAQNATVSGELIAGNLQADSARLDFIESKLASLENATVSGTLYAENIEAKSIQANIITGLEDRLSSKIAETLQEPSLLAALFPNQNGSTEDHYLNELINETEPETSEITNSLEQIDATTGELTMIADSAFINNYFEVNGNAYIAETMKLGQGLMVGDSTILSDNFLSYQPDFSLDPERDPNDFTFSIQPHGMGKLSLMAGLMQLDSQGFVSISGDLKVAGAVEIADELKVGSSLLAGLIAPKNPGENIRVQLASQVEGLSGGTDLDSDELLVAQSNFEFVNETNTPVASFSATGDLSLIGSLRLGQALEIASESGELVSNRSAGQAVLPAGSTEVTILTDKIEPGSMVYITPLNSTNNQVLYVKNKLADSPFTPENEAQFTVAIDYALGHNVTFNWWIIQLN